MATILGFPYPQRRIAHENATGGVAEIVIFPGVRIERTELSLAGRLRPARRRRAETRNLKPEVRNQESEI